MTINWKAAFFTLAALVAGIVAGAWLDRILVRNRFRDLLEMRRAGLLDPRPEKDLGVTPEVEKKIREIVERHAERMAGIHERFRGEIRASFDALTKEIDPLLTPEQRARFRKMIPGPPPRGGGVLGFGFAPFPGRPPGPPPSGVELPPPPEKKPPRDPPLRPGDPPAPES